VTFSIPESPSVNHYYTVARGRKILSAEGRAYKQAVEASIMSQLASNSVTLRSVRVDGPAIFYVTWHRSRRIGDLDNRLKSCGDSLKGLLFNDDAQIVAIYAQRLDSPRNGRMVVSVQPFTDHHVFGT